MFTQKKNIQEIEIKNIPTLKDEKTTKIKNFEVIIII
jgi:hypothetical protein